MTLGDPHLLLLVGLAVAEDAHVEVVRGVSEVYG